VDYPCVYALTVYNDELIAGGSFDAAGDVACNRIARWSGSTWEPLGSGLNASVQALTVYNNEPIAGGWFTAAGSAPCNYIAAWGRSRAPAASLTARAN